MWAGLPFARTYLRGAGTLGEEVGEAALRALPRRAVETREGGLLGIKAEGCVAERQAAARVAQRPAHGGCVRVPKAVT